MVKEVQNPVVPLTDEQIWGVDHAPKPRVKDACPATNQHCPNWDEGAFMCLATGRCLRKMDGDYDIC